MRLNDEIEVPRYIVEAFALLTVFLIVLAFGIHAGEPPRVTCADCPPDEYCPPCDQLCPEVECEELRVTIGDDPTETYLLETPSGDKVWVECPCPPAPVNQPVRVMEMQPAPRWHIDLEGLGGSNAYGAGVSVTPPIWQGRLSFGVVGLHLDPGVDRLTYKCGNRTKTANVNARDDLVLGVVRWRWK